MLLNIAPFYVPESNQFFFSTDTINSFQRNNYHDTFGFWQQNYNVFGHMHVTSKKKYKVYTPKGNPLMWKKWNACSYDEGGSLQVGVREYTPDPVYFKEGICDDVYINSAFDQLLRWDRSGDENLDEEGAMVMRQLLNEVMTNAQLGFRMGGISGDLYDVSNNAIINPENTAAETKALKETHGSIRGALRIAKELGANGYGHMNMNLADDTMFDEVTGYTGDIVALLDELKKGSTKKMRQLINMGGTISRGSMRFMPLIIASESYMNAVVARFVFEADRVATNGRRITRRQIGADGNTPVFVYYYDEMIPIIPLEEINGYDSYLKGTTHFLGFVSSMNMQIGSSFDLVTEVEVEDAPVQVGMMIGKVTDSTRDDYGKTTILSHGLGKAAIADNEFFTGTLTYTEPE